MKYPFKLAFFTTCTIFSFAYESEEVSSNPPFAFVEQPDQNEGIFLEQKPFAQDLYLHQQVMEFLKKKNESFIKISDGSIWIVEKNDLSILTNWQIGQFVKISPKSNWLWSSSSAFVMTNEQGLCVNVNLVKDKGPLPFGDQTTWIAAIDERINFVYLLKGDGLRSIWEIYSSDLYLFKDWEVKDTLIIGERDDLFSRVSHYLPWNTDYDRILFNVNTNQYVRAKQKREE